MKITITTPQFERTPNMAPVTEPPKTREGFEALRSMSAEQLVALGLGSWDGGLFLFPGEWFEHIPPGFEIETIGGEVIPFDPDKEDDDIRFGCLAYGVRIGPPLDGYDDGESEVRHD